MDLSDETSSGSMDLSQCGRDSLGGEAEGGNKSCTHCHTTKTPLWRGGPSGPKTLCNACGIRYRKKVREAMGLQEGEQPRQQQRAEKKGVSALKIQVPGLGSQVMWKRRSWIQKQKRVRRLGEVEQAAVLLMALASGFIYA